MPPAFCFVAVASLAMTNHPAETIATSRTS